MELREVRSFVTLADQLHFGRAARLLNLSQPALTKQIRRLEEELGGELLARGRHGSQLTALGRQFLVGARALVRDGDELIALTRRAARGEAGRLRIWNDAGRLRQVLLNLVGNALKFTANGSVVLGARVSADPLDAGVELFVRDTGPGIADGEHGHIFEPFVQADSSISRRYGGTGLGLSISQNLVELMGGRLAVRSEVGAGSEFIVSLPLATPESPVEAPPGADAESPGEIFAASHPLRILLVEDDSVNRKLMLMLLRKLGYEPLLAEDGLEAVEIYGQEHPDCILMDIQMPRMDGLKATQEIRGLETAAPGDDHVFIAALTANVLDENRRQCLAVGMDGYMSKPLKRALLTRTLEDACAMATPRPD